MHIKEIIGAFLVKLGTISECQTPNLVFKLICSKMRVELKLL